VLIALFIGWDEGVMTMQVGEVARIQVFSSDVKLV
jgi:FKBP-type peptidyl-prolyl cis-trans isomerase